MPDSDSPPGLSAPISLLLAAAVALVVANIYLSQPLAGPIAASVGLHPGAAGLIVTLTQIGYGAGLLLVVPLADRLENRALVLGCIAVATLALLWAGVSTTGIGLLSASLLIGAGSVAVQVLVPLVAHLTPEAGRGRAVGNVMSGLMLGIMLARPVSSLVASLAGWHAVFLLAAATMLVVAASLRTLMPTRRPPPGPSYPALLASMIGLIRTNPVLRYRAATHAGLFAGFSLFWTIVPLLLAHRFGLGQQGIALFALVGVAGAVAAPIAGHAADRGWSGIATRLAQVGMAAAFLMMLAARGHGWPSLLLLASSGVLLDACVTAHLVQGQRALFALDPEIRGRLNGLFMASFFVAGAAASGLGGLAYADAGWTGACLLGLCCPLLALLLGRFMRPG